MHHRSFDMHNLHSTSIIFENQKNKVKWEKFAQESNLDPLLNLTRALASVVSELWKNPKTTKDISICTFYEDGSAKFAIGDDMLKVLRRNTKAIGEDKLALSSKDIVTHSVLNHTSWSLE